MKILISHSGTYKGKAQNIFLPESRKNQLLSFDEAVRKDWARHEGEHIKNINTSEEEIQEEAPVSKLLLEFRRLCGIRWTPLVARKENFKKRLDIHLLKIWFNDEGQIKNLETLRKETDYQFFISRKGKDSLWPMYAAYEQAKKRKELPIPEGAALHHFILRDLDFIGDDLWEEYLKFKQSAFEFRKENFKERLGIHLLKTWLNDEGQIKDLETLRKINQAFFSSRTGKDGLHVIWWQYSKAKKRKELPIPEGAALHHFILRDLDFIGDDLWEEYLDKQRGLQFDRENKEEVDNILSSTPLYTNQEETQLNNETIAELAKNMKSGNKAAYDCLMYKIAIPIAEKRINALMQKYQSNTEVVFQPAGFAERIRGELDRFFRIQCRYKPITAGLIKMRIYGAIGDEWRFQKGTRRKTKPQVTHYSKYDNDSKNRHPAELEARTQEKDTPAPKKLIKEFILEVDTFVINKYTKELHSRNKQILLAIYGISEEELTIGERVKQIALARKFILTEANISHTKRAFEKYILEEGYRIQLMAEIQFCKKKWLTKPEIKRLTTAAVAAKADTSPKPRGVGAAYYNDAAFDEPSEKENRLEAEQSHWSESTRKAFERVKKLKALARPEKVRKDPHYFALTESEWERLIQVKPEAYIRKSGECARGKPSLQEVVVFELETGEEILRSRYIGKNMGRELREHSQKTPVAVSTYINKHGKVDVTNTDLIDFPLKFARRLGFRVFKHGLAVGVRLIKEENKPEAHIDILRDAKTALVTGFRIKEGESPAFIHDIRALYRGRDKEQVLLITKMYARYFTSIIEDLSKEEPVKLKYNIRNPNKIEIMGRYRINLNAMSGMRLHRRQAFVTIEDSLPTTVSVPAAQDDDGKILPSIEIRSLKVPPIKKRLTRPAIVGFDELIVDGKTLSDVVRVFAAKPNGSRGKALFVLHKDYFGSVPAVIKKLYPEQANFVVTNYRISAVASLRDPYLSWEDALPIPQKFSRFREIAELYIKKMKVNRFLLQGDAGLIEVKVKRDRQGKITGLLIREDGKEWVFDYVVADGVDGSGKPVYRLFRKSQARWPLKWARSSGFTGTIRGPINIWRDKIKGYGQLYIQPLKEPNTKKILKPAQLFRHEKLLEEPIELKFKEGELTSFYFPESNEYVPAKEWEIQMQGALGTYEWEKLMKKWKGRLSAIARKEFTGRHEGLYKIVGTDIEDIKAIVEEIFMTQISRLAKGEEIEKKQLNATINQFFNNYAWNRIRNDFELSELQVRRLRKLCALKIRARKEKHKLTDEDIMKEFSLNKEELEEFHKLAAFIFGSQWQFNETDWQDTGRRPDDDLPRGVGAAHYNDAAFDEPSEIPARDCVATIKHLISEKLKKLEKAKEKRPLLVAIDGEIAAGKTEFSDFLCRNLKNVTLISIANFRNETFTENICWNDVKTAVKALQSKGKHEAIIVEGFEALKAEKKESFDFDIKINVKTDEKTRMQNLSRRYPRRSEEAIEGIYDNYQQKYNFTPRYDLIIDNSIGNRNNLITLPERSRSEFRQIGVEDDEYNPDEDILGGQDPISRKRLLGQSPVSSKFKTLEERKLVDPAILRDIDALKENMGIVYSDSKELMGFMHGHFVQKKEFFFIIHALCLRISNDLLDCLRKDVRMIEQEFERISASVDLKGLNKEIFYNYGLVKKYYLPFVEEELKKRNKEVKKHALAAGYKTFVNIDKFTDPIFNDAGLYFAASNPDELHTVEPPKCWVRRIGVKILPELYGDEKKVDDTNEATEKIIHSKEPKKKPPQTSTKAKPRTEYNDTLRQLETLTAIERLSPEKLKEEYTKKYGDPKDFLLRLADISDNKDWPILKTILMNIMESGFINTLSADPETKKKLDNAIAALLKADIRKNLERMTPLLVQALITRAHKEKVLLALDTELGQTEKVRKLLKKYITESFKKIHGNNGDIMIILKNLNIINGEGENLARRIESMTTKGTLKKQNVIMLTTERNLKKCAKFKEDALITAIDDSRLKGDVEFDYYPLVELTFFTILRALAYDENQAGKFQKRLWRWYKQIPNVEKLDFAALMKLCFDQNGGAKRTVILKLIPAAKKFNYGELEELYERIEELIRKA